MKNIDNATNSDKWNFKFKGMLFRGLPFIIKITLPFLCMRETPNTKLESQLLYQVMEIWSWKIRNQLFFWLLYDGELCSLMSQQLFLLNWSFSFIVLSNLDIVWSKPKLDYLLHTPELLHSSLLSSSFDISYWSDFSLRFTFL